MDKKLLALLIAPSLLFTWDCASANENKEFIAESGDQKKQSPKSRQGSSDSQKSQGGQVKGLDRQTQGGALQYNTQESPQRSSGRSNWGQQTQGQPLQYDIQESQQRPSGRSNWGQQTQGQPVQYDTQESPQRSSGRSNWGQQTQGQPLQYDIQESQQRPSDKSDWGRNKKRDIEQTRDSTDQKRDWESEKRDAVKTLPDRFRDRNQDQTDYRRERISKERLQEKEIRWKSKSKEWREKFPNYRKHNHIFDDHFWNHFRKRHNHWYFDNNFQWYSTPTWPRMVVWLPWQWSRPIYYFYETNGDVYYSMSEDFSYLTPVDSKELFIAQAARIASTRYPISKQQSDWMPLGMFAFASEDDWDMPKSYLSLAISKQGAVSGAYFDTANNTMLEVQGGIDPESQRIAWKFVENDWPIMESGLYNLTKKESTLLIHTSNRTTETQLLIRLD